MYEQTHKGGAVEKSMQLKVFQCLEYWSLGDAVRLWCIHRNWFWREYLSIWPNL